MTKQRLTGELENKTKYKRHQRCNAEVWVDGCYYKQVRINI